MMLLAYSVATVEFVVLVGLMEAPGLNVHEQAFHIVGYLLVAVGLEADARPGSTAVQWRARSLARFGAMAALGSTRIVRLHEAGPGTVLDVTAAVACFGLFCLVLAGPPRPELCARPPPPLRRAAFWPKCLFWFWWPEVRRIARIEAASKRSEPALAVHDLPQLSPEQLVAATATAAAGARERRERRAREGKPTSLVAELLVVSRRQLWLQWAWASLDVFGQFLAPLGMNRLVDAIEHGDVSVQSCLFYAALVALGPSVQVVASTQGFHNGWAQATKWRGYLTHLLIEKILALDAGAAGFTVGQMTNLLAVDASFVMSLGPVCVWLVVELCKLAATLAATVWLLGAASLGGFGVVGVVLPLNVWSIRVVKRWQQELMRRKDARMDLVSEAIGAVATIKHHAWEGEFEGRVAKLRDRELAVLRRIKLLEAMTSALINQSPMLAAVATFLCRTVLLGQPLSPAQGFTALALFGMLAGVLSFLPMVVNRYIQAWIALKRLSRFLALRNVDGFTGAADLPRGTVSIARGAFTWPAAPADSALGEPSKAAGSTARRSLKAIRASRGRGGERIEPLLAVTAGVASGEGGRSDVGESASAAPWIAPTLDAVSLHASPGELVVVYGSCGSGKSSLLAALCGEIRHVGGGRGIVSGTVALSPQKPWVGNATLRENVLFGHPMVSAKYDAVLRACALVADIEQLPAGDSTEIGERGVNLSGGQQQRVSLARACYAVAIGQADVILLDDPLSALDASVGAHVFHHAICGLLAGTTRLLVSHAVALTLPAASSVVVLEAGGRLVAQAPPDSVNPHVERLRREANLSLPLVPPPPPSPLSPPVDALSFASAAMAAAPDEEVAMPSAFANATAGTATAVAARSARNGLASSTRSRIAIAGAPATGATSATQPEPAPGPAPGLGANGRLTRTEERARGRAKLRIYLVYMRAFGTWAFILGWVAINVVTAALNPAQSVALKAWLDEMTSAGPPAIVGLDRYLAVAGAFASGQFLRDAMLPFGSVRASRRLHAQMASNVLRATITWFQQTPTGRVLNRFSSDIAAIDSELAGNLSNVLRSALATLAAAAVCTLGGGSHVAAIIVLLAVFASLGLTMAVYLPYVRCAREQKRLESVTKSPLISTFAEACHSASLVRAFGAQQRCAREVHRRCDNANRSIFYLWTTNQWLRVQMSLSEAAGLELARRTHQPRMAPFAHPTPAR